MPNRVQLKRTKGWKIPPNTVKVDRSTKWGNPYRVGDWLCKSKADAVEYYRIWLLTAISYVSDQPPPTIEEIRRELGGKNLACWCKDSPCHADVLLQLANSPASAGAGKETI